VSGCFTLATALMGTVVSIRTPEQGASPSHAQRDELVRSALGWFHRIEACCSRFDPGSEVRRLSGHVGRPVPVSPILYQVVEFSLAVARESGGAFDPTVGLAMERRGFDREYRSGRAARSHPSAPATWRDVLLDPGARTVTLARPLLLDLGAVAKGLAVDLAARELAPLRNFTIDAGGDLWLGGCDGEGQPWSVGIRHPGEAGAFIETIRVSGAAVCTSGDYERPGHVLDARSGRAADALASLTVVAPSAMVADALATAAFVLGPAAGLELLDRQPVDGLLVTPSLERITTRRPGPFQRPGAGVEARAS